MGEGEDRGRAKYLTRRETSAVAANDGASPAFSLTRAELETLVRAAVGEVLSAQHRLVDKQALARLLDCSPSHIDALRKQGLPWVAVGQTVRFEPEAVVAWLRERTAIAAGL